MANVTNVTGILGLINAGAGVGQNNHGIAVRAFVLNIAVGVALFTFEVSGFLLLRSSGIGRRIYQPKTYLVQHRLRVEAIPANPITWLKRIFSITDEELKAKCGLDGFFFIRLIRALLIIFVPLMVIVVVILFPVNYSGGAFNNVYAVEGRNVTYNVTGLDTLSWQNVSPVDTNRYWAHLVCAVLAVGWTLYRIYHEKVNFIHIRQQFLTSPEQRIKASARTVLVTNIPAEYRSKEALEALYDVFVDNDDRSRLTIWVNRDYGALRALVAKRNGLRHALEKAELKILRKYNKKNSGDAADSDNPPASDTTSSTLTDDQERTIKEAFEADCNDGEHVRDLKMPQITIMRQNDSWEPVSSIKFWVNGEKRTVPQIAWLRSEIARLTVKIEGLLLHLDDDDTFPRQNSAFIQFDRQMAAHMACSLVSHHKYGRMAPRFLGVAPHEIVWPNMGVTSLWRLFRTAIAVLLFVTIIFLWGLPTTFLGILSQLDSLRASTSWLKWLQPWPGWVIGLISGPLASILLALLIQLIVPALMRKLAVLVGAPTRSRRELLTQRFYFAFLFIELVLVTSISSGIVDVIPIIIQNPVNIPSILANNLPKAANYFFNYLIIQALGFSGSVLFQYLRLLYITTIWPWFTQTPREEAWLQTTIPHQMWANVYSLTTNFAVIGLIYCIISPLMLVFVSMTFSLFWIAYRHNYYYVQRIKVDTHGLLFNNAISQLFAGVYVSEIALIGLFFLVRNLEGDVVCTPQAIIMIVVLVLTVVFHLVMEQNLSPLYEFLPVTLEDAAVDAEKERFLANGVGDGGVDGDNHGTDDANEDTAPLQRERTILALRQSRPPLSPRATSNNIAPVADTLEKPDAATDESDAKEQSGKFANGDGDKGKMEAPAQSSADPKRTSKLWRHSQSRTMSATAANARRTLLRLRHETATRVQHAQEHRTSQAGIEATSRRRELADQLGAALDSFPDELAELTPEERDAELRAAFQDPVTREPPPVIWIPQDTSGIAEETVRAVSARYAGTLQYSHAGAYLSRRNKCEITQPAPDVRPDWMLDWGL